MVGLRIVAASVLFLGSAEIARAKQEIPSARLLATREGLEDLATQLEQSVLSPAYSEDLRAHARREAQLVRERLSAGDFQIGDQITLVVEGEAALTDTFTVTSGPAITLPAIGNIVLDGVLRSELESHLTSEIARYVRDPVVHAHALIRISVLGEVTRPGFYVVPTETLMSNALMLAGGPTKDAELKEIVVERGGERIWSGESLRKGILEGRTLDQLNLQAGDQVTVPRGGGITLSGIGRFALFSLPAIALAITRLTR